VEEEPWMSVDGSRIDTHAERLEELLVWIHSLMPPAVPVTMLGPCGSPGNEHMWVMVTNKDNVPRTVCAKCGASG
jgi:hypothetical protein